MVVVAVAFVIGGVLGAVLTAALIARGQRALELTSSDLELPVRPADRWRAEQGAEARENDARESDKPYSDSARIERFERELARRLGREAAATVRERREALTRSLRPALGITIRVRP